MRAVSPEPLAIASLSDGCAGGELQAGVFQGERVT